MKAPEQRDREASVGGGKRAVTTREGPWEEAPASWSIFCLQDSAYFSVVTVRQAMPRTPPQTHKPIPLCCSHSSSLPGPA